MIKRTIQEADIVIGKFIQKIVFGEPVQGEPVNNNPILTTTECKKVEYNEWMVRYKVSSRVSIRRY